MHHTPIQTMHTPSLQSQTHDLATLENRLLADQLQYTKTIQNTQAAPSIYVHDNQAKHSQFRGRASNDV